MVSEGSGSEYLGPLARGQIPLGLSLLIYKMGVMLITAILRGWSIEV